MKVNAYRIIAFLDNGDAHEVAITKTQQILLNNLVECTFLQDGVLKLASEKLPLESAGYEPCHVRILE